MSETESTAARLLEQTRGGRRTQRAWLGTFLAGALLVAVVAAAVLAAAWMPQWAPWLAGPAVGVVGLALVSMAGRARSARRAAQVLGEIARLDPESGLPGPRALWSDLVRALDGGRAEGQPLSVVAVTLDELHALHLERGLAAGQKVWRQVSDALGSLALSHGGAAYRVHASALVLVLPRTTLLEAERIAHKLQPSMALVSRRNGGLVHLALGAATAEPGDLPEDLVLRAERRCARERTLPNDALARLLRPVAG